MLCPSCHSQNMEQAAFCTTCATPLKHPDAASPAENSVHARTCGCIQCHAQLTPGTRLCASCGAPQLSVVEPALSIEPGERAQSGPGKSRIDAALCPKNVADSSGAKSGSSKWLPMVAALLVGGVMGGLFVYKMQFGAPGIDSPQPAVVSSDVEAENKNRRTSSAATRSEASKTATAHPETPKAAAARTETREATPVANNVQACQREANLFKREVCMLRACNNRWGTGGCPSYENNQDKAW